MTTEVLDGILDYVRGCQADGWNSFRQKRRTIVVPLLEGAAWVSSGPMEIPGNRTLALLVYGQSP